MFSSRYPGSAGHQVSEFSRKHSSGLPRIKIPEQSICLAKGQAAETLGQVDGCQVVVRLGRLLTSAERTIASNPLKQHSSTISPLSEALEPVKSMQFDRWTVCQLCIKITMVYLPSTATSRECQWLHTAPVQQVCKLWSQKR